MNFCGEGQGSAITRLCTGRRIWASGPPLSHLEHSLLRLTAGAPCAGDGWAVIGPVPRAKNLTAKAMETKLQVVEADANYEKVSLTNTTDSGYIHVAAEVDRRLPFLPASRAKRTLLRVCKRLCESLEQREDVKSAVTFKALLIPPGRGEFLEQRPSVHVARFDVALLIETTDVAAARTLRQKDIFAELEERVRRASRHVHIITASNAKRIGPVDHERNGVFLFNYFYADDTDQNLAVWEYTAGWFEQETGLDNSTLLLPTEGEESEYSIINHCRWDHLWDIVPSLLFKSSFRSYVLDNFKTNRTAAMPILYSLA